MGRKKGSINGQFGSSIDKEQFEKLCSILCTEMEICGFFNVSHDTLNRWCHQEYNCTFEEIFDKKSALGKISLRRMQFKQAETNPSMAIWLGKQLLNQSEKVEATTTDKIEIVNDVPKEDEEEE